MFNPQFHPDPPPQITEEDIEEEEIQEEIAFLETADAAAATRRIEILDAIGEDSNARVRLAERLVGEELVEIDDGDSEDDEDLELEEPDDDSPSEDGAGDGDDEWPEQEEGPWSDDSPFSDGAYDESGMDL